MKLPALLHESVPTTGIKGMGLGDIAVLQGTLAHHCIVTDLGNSADGAKAIIETVNDNSDYQGITIKQTALKQICCYHTIDDSFYDSIY